MAKPELRAQAEVLRQAGCSVPDIASRLGVARSTAFRWVRHIALDSDAEAAERRRAHSRAMTDARWGAHRVQTAQRRQLARDTGQAVVGELTEQDLALVGAVIFWCEGAKEKPWANDGRVTITNTDPRLLRIFIRFLESAGVSRSELTYRVSIHETADPDEAARWWADELDVPLDCFRSDSEAAPSQQLTTQPGERVPRMPRGDRTTQARTLLADRGDHRRTRPPNRCSIRGRTTISFGAGWGVE